MKKLLMVVVLFVFSLFLFSCNGDDNTENNEKNTVNNSSNTCASDTVEACTCDQGGEGEKKCNSAGTGWEECDCNIQDFEPEITSKPSTHVSCYEKYEYIIECKEENENKNELKVGALDTCEGEINKSEDDSIVYSFTAGKSTDGWTCDIHIVCSNTNSSFEQIETINMLSDCDISNFVFLDFEHFASPIDDYIQTNTEAQGNAEFNKSIDDLIVYDDNLYLGYGDATYNLSTNGKIEVRYFTEQDATSITADFSTDEEEISLYRILNDVLVIPGVDAHEDDLLGNVYTFEPGKEWFKSRTLEMAWHVHDITVVGSVYYASGSGGTLEDYDNSTVNAYLWKSEDGGQTFTVAQSLAHPNPPGDHRLVNLLTVNNILYAFGYYSSNGTSYPIGYKVGGNIFYDIEEFKSFFTLGTYQLSPDKGLVHGVIVENPVRFGVKYITSQGVEEAVSLKDITVVDVFLLNDGRAIITYYNGNTYPTPETEAFDLLVGLLTENDELIQIKTQQFQSRPVSVSFWRNSLYLGFANGEMWRSIGFIN